MNVQKFTAISDVIENCLRFQDRGYTWLADNSVIQNLIDHFPLLSDDEAHQNSLLFEPKRGSVANAADVEVVGGVNKLRRSSLVQKAPPIISLEPVPVAPVPVAPVPAAPPVISVTVDPAPEINLRSSQSSPVIVIFSEPQEEPRQRSVTTGDKSPTGGSSPRRRKKSVSSKEELEKPAPAKDSLSIAGSSSGGSGPSPKVSPRLKRVSLRKKKPEEEEEEGQK